jgi:uncharacterized cupredoxin-like copper-binding protein
MRTQRILFISALLGCAVPSIAWAHDNALNAPKSMSIKKGQTDWGIAGSAKSAKRTVSITMMDTMRFSPEKIKVKQGDTLKFAIHNSGITQHEFVIGTKQELDAHAALMQKFPNMEHSEPYMSHVPPGKTGSIVWTFNKAGKFNFACLIAGHYQSGMVGNITVLAAK